MNNNKKVSPEIQKFIDDLEKQKIEFTVNSDEIHYDDEFENKERNPFFVFIAKVACKIIGVSLAKATDHHAKKLCCI